MKPTKPKHFLYWVLVLLTIPVILLGIAGQWLNENLEPLYGAAKRWCYSELYCRHLP